MLGMVTEVTVRPTTSLARPEKPTFGVYTPGDTDNISVREVLSGLNPIHHIPFASQLMDTTDASTPRGAAASVGKLVVGALLGGPLGFLASLANVVYEQQSGESMIASAAHALTGEETTQVAQAKTAADAYEVASLAPAAGTPTQEILPPEATVQANQKIASAVAQDKAIAAQMQMANAMGALADPLSKQDQDVLTLFGAEQKSAHKSYQNAQMRNYLNDVTVSQVM